MDFDPHPAEPKSTLAGTVAWGGAILWHFGHQIADFTTRLVPTLAELPDVRFAFTMREPPQFTTIEETPAHFRAILDWYGIAHERVELIAEPTLVERLVVAPQAEQPQGPGPDPWYLDLLDENTRARLGKIARQGTLYVSRAGQSARFAGEGYIESAMESAGFSALRPETLPLEEQLRAYAGADSIVFAEGSAIHGTQLMGRALGDVRVLVRRADGGRATEPILKPRTRSLRFVNALRGLVHGLDTGGGRALFRGLSVLDPELLLAELPLGDVWAREAYERARDADVLEWLENERSSNRWGVPGSSEKVLETLRAAGLAHLG
jgi:glycosyl transferase family 61